VISSSLSNTAEMLANSSPGLGLSNPGINVQLNLQATLMKGSGLIDFNIIKSAD